MPDPIILPTTFNDDNNVVAPDIFNDDNNVDAPETYKLVKLVLLKIEVDVAFKLLIDKIELVDNEFKLLNTVVDVACKFGIFNAEYVDKLFKFVLVAYTDKSGLFVIAL